MSTPATPAGQSASNAPHLDRRLRLVHYYTFGFGTMVGVGWLIVIDDWLTRGGPFGAMLGFTLGGLFLLPVGLTYARLVAFLPDAGGEVAYTERVFPRWVSFVTGWSMALAYLIVCPWEAVAIGKLLSWAIPQLDSLVLYQVAGKPVYLYRLLFGLALTALITALNYRGIRFAAGFQTICTFALLAVFVVFSTLGFAHGTASNLAPLFSQPGTAGAFVSILLVLQIVPYYMMGFESIAKASEEARSDFLTRGFRTAIILAMLSGTLFYGIVCCVVPYVSPWRALTSVSFGTAVAFERAFHSRFLVRLIFVGAVASLFKVFNGNFVAGSRMVYGLAKRNLVRSALADIHPRFLTPHAAVLFAAALTAAGALLGEAVLIPISEVGSLAVAVGWLASCLSLLRGVTWAEGGRPSLNQRLLAWAGAAVSLALILIKILPIVPGHLRWPEYASLAVWFGLGLVLARRGRSAESVVDQTSRNSTP